MTDQASISGTDSAETTVTDRQEAQPTHGNDVSGESSNAQRQDPRAAAGSHRFSQGSIITTVTAAVGGLALLGVAGVGMLTGSGYNVASFSYGDESVVSEEIPTTWLSGDGITKVDIDAKAADVTLGFGDVSEIMVEAKDGNGNPIGGWNMYTEGSRLLVERYDGWGCVMDCELPENQEFVTITLPHGFADPGTLQVDAGIESGLFHAEGDFGQLGIDARASVVTFAGSATDLALAVSGGSAEVETTGTTKTTVDSEASTVVLKFTGTAPDRLVIDAAMSKVEATLPEGKYHLQDLSESAGVESALKTSEKSKHVVRVDATASEVTLR